MIIVEATSSQPHLKTEKINADQPLLLDILLFEFFIFGIFDQNFT